MRDANVSWTSSELKKIVVGGLAALAIGIFVTTAALVFASRSAEAKPEYAAKEGKPCGYCHANPAGGGDRNAMGKKYEANGHTFKK